MVAVAGLAMLLAIVPGSALAGENAIDQGGFDADADGDDIFENDAEFVMGSAGLLGAQGRGGSFDVALAGSNCQLITVADAWVLVLAANAALGLISDEDDIVVAATPANEIGDGMNLDAETATSTCTTGVGPVKIHVSTAPGWGDAAPHGGSWADVMRASHGGGGGGASNTINQGGFSADSELDDTVHNDALFLMNVVNGAAAASNCQALIGAHMGAAVAGANVAAGSIEDSDSIEVAGEDGLGTESVDVDLRLRIEVENDHTATSSCEQPIESIHITVGDMRDHVGPES